MAIPARIIIFGSSSTYGRGDPEGGGFVGRLRRWHEPKAVSNLVYNLGVGGDTSKDMKARFQSEVSHRRPDLILIYPGLNDTRRSGSLDAPTALSLDNYRRNIGDILEQAVCLAPTILMSSFPIDESRTAPWRASSQPNIFYLANDATKFSDALSSLAAQRQIPYMAVYETWSKRPNAPNLSIDGLHASPEAHELLYQELRAFLCDTYGEKKPLVPAASPRHR